MNKHKVMQDWVQGFLDDNYLYFENVNADPGIMQIVPNYGDYIRFTDILGRKHKSYSFVFIGYETLDVGTSDVNTDTMDMFDKFARWLEAQKRDKNFPDFGENCSDYDIIILQNMANVSIVSDDNLAKYMFGARIDYTEEE